VNAHAPTQDKLDDTKDSFYEDLEHVFDKFPKYHMDIILVYFSAKDGRRNIFKAEIWNQTSYEISNDSELEQ
jgi:hypothetical protein